MSDRSVESLLSEIADDYLLKVRQNNRPDVDFYVQQYPEMRAEIEELLETFAFVHDLKADETNDHDFRFRDGMSAAVEPEEFPEIDDFKILRVAGRGGMGVVYEAEQVSLSRHVALKVLPGSLRSNPQSIERFKLEARSAAGLHHSNIVPVYEVGISDKHCFYAMQFIDGQTLDAVTRELAAIDSLPTQSDSTGKPSERETLRGGVSATLQTDNFSGGSQKPFYRNVAKLGVQVASALHYAHEKGIIHRDIKPANLMMDESGTVWVTDFGLVKTEDESLTRTGDIVGTLRYMSPERFSGKCDARSDIYSLGMTLYNVLARQDAFLNSDRLSLIDAIKSSEPVSLAKLDKRIPRDLQTIIEKSIDKEPRRRYQSADEMAADLNRFVEGRPIKARSVGPIEKLALWARKNKALASSVATIAALVLLGAIGSGIAAFIFREQSIEQSNLAQNNLALAEENQRERMQAVSDRDRAVLSGYYADMQLAAQDWKNGQLRRMLTTLQRYVPVGQDADVRNWEWYYLLSLAHQDRKTIFEHDREMMQVRWAKGGRVLSASIDGVLKIRDAEGKELRTISIPNLQRFAVSGDGKQFATVNGSPVLRYWDTETGDLIRAVRTELKALVDVHWSTGSDRIVVVSEARNDSPLVYNTTDDTIVAKPEIAAVKYAQISPDGKWLATHRHQKISVIHDLESGKTVNELFLQVDGDSQVHSFAWHPDSKRFATGHYISGAQLFELNPGERYATQISRLKKSSSVESVSFSKDGKSLLTADRSQVVEVYDCETLKRVRQFRGHLDWVTTADWSPDSVQLVTGGRDTAIKFWDVSETDANVEEDPPVSGTLGEFRWNYDSKTLLFRVFDDANKEVAEIENVIGAHQATLVESHNKLIVRIYPNDIEVWDTQTWEKRKELSVNTTHSIQNSYYSWQGDFVAGTNGGGHVAIVDLEDESLRRVFAHDSDRVGLDLSPDGTQLATLSYGDVKLWESKTGKLLASLYGHDPNRWSSIIAWGNQGQFLATGGGDQKVIIWDANAKEKWRTLDGHQSVPNEIYFSADDSRLMSVGKSLKIWDVQTGREIVSFDVADFRVKASDFVDADPRRDFGLDNSALQFENLSVLKTIASDTSKLKAFEFQNSHIHALRLFEKFSDDRDELQLMLASAENAFSLQSTDLATTQLLAGAQLQNEKYDDAAKTIKLALAIDPDNVNTILLDVWCRSKSGELASAKASFSQLIKSKLTVGHSNSPFDESVANDLLLDQAISNIYTQRAEDADSTITVNTLEDEIDGTTDGSISLREALAIARPGDTIKFSVTGVIALDYGQLFLKKPISIVGPEASKLSIDGRLRWRLFWVDDRKADFADVTITGIKLNNGKAPVTGGTDDWACRGGAILAREKLMLHEVVFENNSAQRGGAIWVDNGSTTEARNCSFQNNTGVSGGGAINVSGARWGMPAHFISIGSVFFQNQSNVAGGAIYSYGSLKMVNSTVHENIARAANQERNDWRGGGIELSLIHI